MNGPQHYKAAEDALVDLGDYLAGRALVRDAEGLKVLIQGHALLALTAATVTHSPLQGWEEVLKP